AELRACKTAILACIFAVIQVPSRQRYRLRVRARVGTARGEDLVDAGAAGFELQRARRHVQAPHAVGGLAHVDRRLVVVLLETAHPVAQRARVVDAQVLDVLYLEIRLLPAAL